MLRVLITGMSGTGKSTLVQELRRRGYTAYDADDDGYTEPRDHGGWGWRSEAVQELFDRTDDSVLFFSGCSEEQAEFDFDVRVLLSAPEAVIVERLDCRRTNPYGKKGDELTRVLSDRKVVEPMLRRSADLIIETTRPVDQVADLVVDKASEIAESTGREYALSRTESPLPHPGSPVTPRWSVPGPAEPPGRPRPDDWGALDSAEDRLSCASARRLGDWPTTQRSEARRVSSPSRSFWDRLGIVEAATGR